MTSIQDNITSHWHQKIRRFFLCILILSTTIIFIAYPKKKSTPIIQYNNKASKWLISVIEGHNFTFLRLFKPSKAIKRTLVNLEERKMWQNKWQNIGQNMWQKKVVYAKKICGSIAIKTPKGEVLKNGEARRRCRFFFGSNFEAKFGLNFTRSLIFLQHSLVSWNIPDQYFW